jgi:hypothetical protein
MNLSTLKRRNRQKWVAQMLQAIAESGGVWDAMSASLRVSRPRLYEWLCEPELAAIPMINNCGHPSIRFRPGLNVDLDLVPLAAATESLEPLAPNLLSCCQSDEHRERGKVRVTFLDSCPAHTWLAASDATRGWRFDHPDVVDLVIMRRGTWTMRARPVREFDDELYMFTSIWFPRAELAATTESLRRSGKPRAVPKTAVQ